MPVRQLTQMIDNKTAAVVAGVDIGSLYAKAVVMSSRGKILASSCMKSGFDYSQISHTVVEQAVKSAGLGMADISNIIATGYGRGRVSFASNTVSEITCHGRGISQLLPEARTVIDIGGQDSKVIWLNDSGKVTNFVMNDKCAAGTGRFLEVMANSLGVDLDGMSELSLNSKNKVTVSSVCTVFAETEVISLISSGCSKEDIAAAIFAAISKRIAAMVGQQGVRERVAMSGGVAKSKGVVRALERILGTSILVPEEPQIVGALGAAIMAAEMAAPGKPDSVNSGQSRS